MRDGNRRGGAEMKFCGEDDTVYQPLRIALSCVEGCSIDWGIRLRGCIYFYAVHFERVRVYIKADWHLSW